jgi:putative acetyltransferase
MIIREERAEDAAAISRINNTAFEGEAEANLVIALRAQNGVIVSLVAEEQGRPVGHILFSPLSLLPKAKAKLAALAPMAVLPEFQRRGIGSALVQAGIEACRKKRYGAIIVIGHPNFYPRFGFVPAQEFGLRTEYDVPAEAFMALELKPGALAGQDALVQFHPAFAEL